MFMYSREAACALGAGAAIMQMSTPFTPYS